MSSKLVFKLGAPIIALSLVAACGTGTNKAPVKEEVPVKDQAPLEQRNNEAPVEDHNLDRNLDNGNNNPVDEGIPQDNLNGTHKENENR